MSTSYDDDDDILPPGAKRLKKLRVVEVSVVRAPACVAAQISICKAGDALDAAVAQAKAYVTAGEIQGAVAMARAGTPAPRSFWQAHLDALVAGIAQATGAPPSMSLRLAVARTDGAALVNALAKAV